MNTQKWIWTDKNPFRPDRIRIQSGNIRTICIPSADVLDLHPAFLDAISDEMILGVDMFAAIVKDRGFAEHNNRLVVDLESGGAGFLGLELGEKSRQPDSLAGSGGGCNVLRFTRTERHDLLLLGLPDDEVAAKEEKDSSGAAAHVDVAGEITVAVTN